jgi:hypothetical protein
MKASLASIVRDEMSFLSPTDQSNAAAIAKRVVLRMTVANCAVRQYHFVDGSDMLAATGEKLNDIAHGASVTRVTRCCLVYYTFDQESLRALLGHAVVRPNQI